MVFSCCRQCTSGFDIVQCFYPQNLCLLKVFHAVLCALQELCERLTNFQRSAVYAILQPTYLALTTMSRSKSFFFKPILKFKVNIYLSSTYMILTACKYKCKSVSKHPWTVSVYGFKKSIILFSLQNSCNILLRA